MTRIDHQVFRQLVLEDGMELFAFESDFVASLRCIPMAVRFKLDLACIKVSLRQWSRFTLAERSDLLAWRCLTTKDVEIYRSRLVEMIATRTGEPAKPITLDPALAIAADPTPPASLLEYARALGLNPPTTRQWSTLAPLRRFTLLKLTREGHDNVNFVPAMREFGLSGQ
jgi:hypothetical protein